MSAGKLITVDAETLLLSPLEKPLFIVEDFLPVGLHVFCGAPKVGKSWLVLDLAICIMLGEPFWGYATSACEVLYLCLEDTLVRIQQRLFKLTDRATGRLHFTTESNKLDGGLVAQIEDFLLEHPDTKLIILDTFQVIRSQKRENAYAADYDDLSRIKRFADTNGLAVLLVHHTRKLPDTDVFNTVSGTTGITGCADSTFILSKESRHDNEATLCVSGRDIEFQEFRLRFRDCRWELLEKTSTEELEERSIPVEVLNVLDFMANVPHDWRGNASELLAEIGIENVSPPVLSKRLNEHRHFLEKRGVKYGRERNREARVLVLSHVDGGDGGDSNDA